MSEKKSATKRLKEATAALESGIAPDASVGIRELRDHLSRYLEQVKAGAAITVTEHGRVIATIVPMRYSRHMLELAAQGKVRLPTRPPMRVADIPKVEIDGGLSDLLREVRL
ncbi:MAG TPA: type II toxin-antitoxin system prevent-host-death family antitoxin [Candidatus Sulfomarinibacteraceae bacterium]|nr:type II toxin-antitoxin system prevent-host-death family antitoxin [Candidatus Sulfomarinibacteraceae bacterium]